MPDDAFAEKYQLLRERDKLREEAAGYGESLEASRPAAQLLAELASLRAQLKKLAKQKINLVSQAGSGLESAAIGDVINARITEASGADRIQARIAIISNSRTKRGVKNPR